MEYKLEDIRSEMDEVRERINNMRSRLKDFFVKKEDHLDLMVLCMATQEPLLIVGPPGTAKSDLIVKFCQALGLDGSEYFEYLLTKFTEPSEIIGPIDISALKDGRYLRKVGGKLPEAKIAFLDEIFKSNSAILNALLTIINEKKYYQDGQPVPVALKMLFAATNEIPEFTELSALKDRFTLKIQSNPVSDTHFEQLLCKGLRNDNWKSLNQKPWAELAKFEDFIKVKAYVDQLLQRALNNQPGEVFDDPYFPEEIQILFKRILKTLVREDKLSISDRKIVKLYKLIRTRAFLFRGEAVSREDLSILRYTADRLQDFEAVANKVDTLLSLK